MALYTLANGPSDPLFWFVLACVILPVLLIIGAGIASSIRERRAARDLARGIWR